MICALSPPQALKTKELTLLIWSLARCGHHDDPLFSAAPASLLHRLQRGVLGWQDMAHTLWAYSSAGKYDARIFSAISEACAANLPGFVACPPALDTVVGSLGIVGHYHPELFRTVALRLRDARVVAGSDMHEEQDGRDLHALAREIAGQPDGASGDERASGDSVPAPGAVSSSRRQRGGAASSPARLILKPAQAANLLAALASLNHRDHGACAAVVAGLTEALQMHPTEVPMSAVAKCCWALAVLEYRDLPFMQLAFSHVAMVETRRREAAEGRQQLVHLGGDAKPTSTSFSGPQAALAALDSAGEWAHGKRIPHIRETMQLLQATLWLTEQAGDGEGGDDELGAAAQAAQRVLQSLPTGLLARARSVWQSSAAHSVTVSQLQKDVHAALTQLRLSPRVRGRGGGRDVEGATRPH